MLQLARRSKVRGEPIQTEQGQPQQAKELVHPMNEAKSVIGNTISRAEARTESERRCVDF